MVLPCMNAADDFASIQTPRDEKSFVQIIKSSIYLKFDKIWPKTQL